MSTQKTIALNPHSKGFVSIIVNAMYEQQVSLEVKRSDGTHITSATFEGQGERVHARDIFNNREYWSFGPFTYSANLYVTVRHKYQGIWRPSKSVGPLAIHKAPEPDYPIDFHLATIISEDDPNNDASHDDCTVQVLQYK